MNGNQDFEQDQASSSAGGYDSHGMEEALSIGVSGRRESGRPSSLGSAGSSREQPRETDPGGHEHYVRRGRHPRVLQPKDLDNLEVMIHDTFASGDPNAAWEATRELIATAHTLQKEAATSRFKANFGTELCSRCEGLKAGPDVAATCFQMKQCYYTNFKVEADLKQARLIETLSNLNPNHK